ncbi:MAG: hypothetical protein ACLRH0_05675 [Blautia wexlerae]
MKKINLRDYYPYYTQDMIVEVPDEVALLLREYMLLEEAYRIRTYRYKAFYSLDRDEGIEREILQKPLNPAEIWEQRQMTELIYKGLSKLPVKAAPTNLCTLFLGMSKADIAKAEGTHKAGSPVLSKPDYVVWKIFQRNFITDGNFAPKNVLNSRGTYSAGQAGRVWLKHIHPPTPTAISICLPCPLLVP